MLLTPPPPQLGVADMVHLLNNFQDSAHDPAAQLSTLHRVSLHTITAGILHLLTNISSVTALREHVAEVIERRREAAPMLLPDGFFAGTPGEEGEEGGVARGDLPTRVDEDLLFRLREKGLVRPSPEPSMDPTARRSLYL